MSSQAISRSSNPASTRQLSAGCSSRFHVTNYPSSKTPCLPMVKLSFAVFNLRAQKTLYDAGGVVASAKVVRIGRPIGVELMSLTIIEFEELLEPWDQLSDSSSDFSEF